jgi:hypothetical protein
MKFRTLILPSVLLRGDSFDQAKEFRNYYKKTLTFCHCNNFQIRKLRTKKPATFEMKKLIKLHTKATGSYLHLKHLFCFFLCKIEIVNC